MAEVRGALKAGPLSLDEFCSWPVTVIRSLIGAGDGDDGERLHRLRFLLQRGLWIDSDYSGVAGEYEVMHQMLQALKHIALEAAGLGGESAVSCFNNVKVVHGRFCDKGKQQQDILKYISSLHNNSVCLFGDLNDRLPTAARQLLDSMIPETKVTPAEAKQAYSNMSQWLMENRAWVFAPAGTSPCLIHGTDCPLVKSVEPASTSPATPPPKRRRLSFSESDTSKMDVAGEEESVPLAPASSFLRVNLAGTTCTGWSSAGKGLHFADPSERPHAIWLAERVARAEQGVEDMVISECTPRYPVKEKLADLEKTHEIIYLHISPMQLGWPVRRSRVFTCSLNRESMAWVGPDQSAVADHFLQLFGREIQATADVFLAATDAEVFDFLRERASKRGVQLPEDMSWQDVSMQHVYAPGQLVRLENYEKARQEVLSEKHSDGADDAAVAGDSGPSRDCGAWYADLEQNPGHGASTPGPILPSALTHGTLHSWSANRPMLPMEQYVAHGWNVFADRTSWKHGCEILPALQKRSMCQQKKMLGNGWHLPVIASWWFYCMCHSVKLDRAASIQPERTLLRSGGSSFSLGQDSQQSLSSFGDCGAATDSDMSRQQFQSVASDSHEENPGASPRRFVRFLQ
ncbi:unnamed protein product [Symbiodinium sp. CCMP2592]|nr:unnamed protein product [Symbiodinium sp. CCMP2592]